MSTLGDDGPLDGRFGRRVPSDVPPEQVQRGVAIFLHSSTTEKEERK